MDTQCNALYGTALYQRECLTTPKNSEGNRLLAAFLYRDIASFAVLRNRISLIINRVTPPTQIYTLPSKRAVAQANSAEGIPLFHIFGNKGNNGLPFVTHELPCEDGSTRYPFSYGFSYPEKGVGQSPRRGNACVIHYKQHFVATHSFGGNNLYVNNRKTFNTQHKCLK